MNNSVKRKKNRRTASPRFFTIMMFIGAFALCAFMVCLSITPQKYDIEAGEIATDTIQAPRDIVDEVSTQAQIDRAVAAVVPIFKQDAEITDNVLADVHAYFTRMEELRDLSERRYLFDQPDTVASQFRPGDVNWQSSLSTASMEALSELSDGMFSSADIYQIASLTSAQVTQLTAEITASIADELNLGIREENLSDHRERLQTQMLLTSNFDDAMIRLGNKAFDLLKPNMLLDETATELERQAVRESVVPVTYKTGQNIVQQGEVVTSAQIALLNELGFLHGDDVDYTMYAGIIIYLFISFTMFFVYVIFFERRLTLNVKRMGIIFIVITAVVALTIAVTMISSMVTAVFLGAILIAAVIKPRTAIMCTLLMAFITVPVGTSGEGILSQASFCMLASSFVGGTTAVYIIRRTQHRIAIIVAGAAAGLVGGIMTIAFGMVSGTSTQLMLQNGGLSLLSGVVGGILAIGVLPVFESMFKLATPTKLLELLNPNQKLLRRLSIEAPATYHHSTITANLAEEGAEAIGANSLLVRTAAYYHDIGKLKNPGMFTENQRSVNPHDNFTPEVSCEVIRSHVVYGNHLANKNNLPREIIDMIEQHHGTMPIGAFFFKAREKDPNANIADYSYSGPRPQTVEAAVLMLADCTEAAVKSMGLSEGPAIGELMDKLFADRMHKGQFDDCALTFRDLSVIKKAFLSVYEGVFHDRVKYPDEEKRDAKD